MAPTVSINLCCYNSDKFLEETLQSIFGQTYKDWELVVINDGSTDATETIINKYIKYGYPISYHYQKNKGLGYSRNKALKRSQGEFIAFIDHDDIWMPEKLERQIPLFRRNEKVAIVISNAILFNDNGDSALYYKRNKPKIGYVFRELFGNNFICLSSTVIRRSSLDNLNEWFDDRFNHIEDGELFARIAYNWHLDYVDHPLVKNRIHRKSSTFLRPELSPQEVEIMIRKFESLFPEFKNNFKKEIQQLEYYIQYCYSLSDWKTGDNARVRERIKPFFLKNSKATIQFICSFFPYKFYMTMLLLYRKHVRQLPEA